MNNVGVTREWSAKDLLAHLAYWVRAAAEQVREFETGEKRNRSGDETSARGTGGKVSARAHRLLSVCAA